MHIQTITRTDCCNQNSGISTSCRQIHVPVGSKAVLLISVFCAGLMGCAESKQYVPSDRATYETNMSNLDGLAFMVPGI